MTFFKLLKLDTIAEKFNLQKQKVTIPKLLWFIAIFAFLIGCVGFLDRLLYGFRSHNLSSYINWGLMVAGYIYFIGLSAGAFLLSSMVYVFKIEKLKKIGKFSLFVALVCLIMAMFSIFFDLGHPFRSLIRFFISPNFGSMMGWMIILYSVYFVIILLELTLVSYPDISFKGWNLHQLFKPLAVIGFIIALISLISEGSLFAVVKARPYWHTGLFPILFIVEALFSGGALITLLTYIILKDKQIVDYLRKIVLSLLILYVIMFLSELLVVSYGDIPHHIASYKVMMFGDYAGFFWVGQVLMVILLPLYFFIFKKESSKHIALACLLIVIGFIAVRLNIVVPGLIVPPFEGLRTAIIDNRLKFEYFPSLTEWLFELWVLSIGLIIFLIGYKYLPLLKEDKNG